MLTPTRLRSKHAGAPIAQALFWEFCRFTLAFLLTLLYRVRYYGLHNIPRGGAYLIVANHQSHIDPPAVGIGAYDRAVHIVAREGLFRPPGFGWAIAALHTIPIDESGAPDTRAIREIIRRLKVGHAVLLFPEGSRSPDGRMQEFKRGVSLVVKKSECPVLPAAIEGAFDAWPRHRKLPRFLGKRIAIVYGKPIPHAELMKDGAPAAMERLAREVSALRQEAARRLGRS